MHDALRQIASLKADLKDKDICISDLQADLKDLVEDKSLHAVIVGEGIAELTRLGSPSSHLNPKNHKPARVIKKVFMFNMNNLMSAIERLKVETGRDPKLKKLSSVLIHKMKQATPIYYVEADVATYLQLALGDAVSICNVLLKTVAPHLKIELVARQEMSIFSNRCDHVVVCDSMSGTPLFCVETKKHFDESVPAMEESKLFGQCFDQLKFMQAMGYTCPLGALSCFNQTYITSLSNDIEWDALPTLSNLQDTLTRLPGMESPANGTPPPHHVEQATGPICQATGATHSFQKDKGRTIFRSKDSIKQDNLVGAFVVIILKSLTGFHIKKPFRTYTIGQLILTDCIQMTPKTYRWGELRTQHHGPCEDRRIWPLHTTFYLLHCIGSGSTSKAYYAVTKDGNDCVVKIYLQSHDENGKLKDSAQFKSDSKMFVKNEKKNYQKIYGDVLCKYVHVRKLNRYHCVILPFFEPISTVDRSNITVLNSIKKQLQRFVDHKMAFRDCDQKWRHIGRFNNEIYLFDLADLQQCDTKEAAQTCAVNHLRVLKEKSAERLLVDTPSMQSV
jgi:hypothetical protein